LLKSSGRRLNYFTTCEARPGARFVVSLIRVGSHPFISAGAVLREIDALDTTANR
jgi:hypothetical protein